ncbi:hypothetical protein Fmac_030628 [Flemingia macrophylla]|uniref:Uncharacterized protein n=1 Tax=Flemingia macrophylla TaxID=520843 RepID=A0ABD1KZQ8_9FABA
MRMKLKFSLLGLQSGVQFHNEGDVCSMLGFCVVVVVVVVVLLVRLEAEILEEVDHDVGVQLRNYQVHKENQDGKETAYNHVLKIEFQNQLQTNLNRSHSK